MIKKVLLSIALILSIIGGYMARGIMASLFNFLITHPTVMWATGAAVVIQIIGHILRAKRTKLVLDQAAKSSLQFQFGALSVGYLFNVLLPFRLGELVRALLISKRLHISFLYTFVAVMIERATDVIFLSLIVIIGLSVLGGSSALNLILIAAFATTISVGVLYGLYLLKNENDRLLRTIARASHIFNEPIRDRLRFKVWSLIFGLQGFTKNKQLVYRYLGYMALSWLCYFASALLIAMSVLSINGLVEGIITSVSPYIISFSPLNASSYDQLVSSLPIQIDSTNLDIYAQLIWAVLILPMAGIGLIALFLYRPGTAQSASKVKDDPYVNKLIRHKDISREFPVFLDSYFSGNLLARILHKIEVSGSLSLVRFFKGGSDAITILVLQRGDLFVKKIIPLEYRDRLKAQHDWLVKNKKMHYLVDVISEQDAEDYYAIDIAYDPSNIPFFEYIHHNSLTQSKAIIDKVWGALYNHLHKNGKEPAYRPKDRSAYIEKHVFGCADKAASAHEPLRRALELEKLVINGVEYDNLYQILDKIKSHKQAWRDIATYRKSGVVHGDPSVDNFLVSSATGKPLIIDPAPDGNIMDGPVFDMGKLMQSFYCGYEFLFRDEDLVELGPDGSINYREQRTEQYVHLSNYIRHELAPKYLSEAERKAIIFHGGVLLIRRLKHQVHYNPDNTLKFYAVGVKTLNEFLAQYD